MTSTIHRGLFSKNMLYSFVDSLRSKRIFKYVLFPTARIFWNTYKARVSQVLEIVLLVACAAKSAHVADGLP